MEVSGAGVGVCGGRGYTVLHVVFSGAGVGSRLVVSGAGVGVSFVRRSVVLVWGEGTLSFMWCSVMLVWEVCWWSVVLVWECPS